MRETADTGQNPLRSGTGTGEWAAMSFLVVDIGSSGCRAALVSADGDIEAITRSPLVLNSQSPPLAEADCERVWNAVSREIGRVTASKKGLSVDAVGVSSVLGYVLLDRGNRPLAPAVLYADSRAAPQVQKILSVASDRDIQRLTGRRASPESLAAQLLWLKDNRPELEGRIHKIIGLKDEIVRRLTGVVATDLAHANYTMLFNVSEGRFDAGLMEELRIGPGQLFPEPAPPDRIVGRLSREAAGELGLSAGTPVVQGSSDGTTAMFGGGIYEKGKAVLVSGTTDVLMTLADTYPEETDPALTVNSGALPGEFMVGGATGLSGGSLTRFETLFRCSLDELEPRMTNLPPGSGGLLVFPGLTGERAPYWQSSLSGAICGLTPDHGPENVFKALLEATAYRLRRLISALGKSGLSPEAVKVTGGMGRLDLANRIRAQVTGVDMLKMAQTEATCLGTAAFCQSALMGGGCVHQVSEKWTRVVERFVPDTSLAGKYDAMAGLFERYLQTAEALHRELRKLR